MLATSFLPIPQLICRVPLLSHFFNDQVVWHQYSASLLWHEMENREVCFQSPHIIHLGEAVLYLTVLTRACSTNAPLHHVRTLLNADPDGVHVSDALDCKAIECASMADNDRADIVEALLIAKADPNAQDDTGDSPLHHAVCCGHSKVVTTLLRYNANVNIIGEDGFTPLMDACRCDNVNIVEILLNHNADISIETALDIVQRYKCEDDRIMQMLLDHNHHTS